MSNSGYEAPDKPGPSHPVLPENQRRGRKIVAAMGKRLGTRRKTLSRREQDMQQLQNLIDQAPDIREDRVAAAKQALQAGTLELRGEELAERVLCVTSSTKAVLKHNSRQFLLGVVVIASAICGQRREAAISAPVSLDNSLKKRHFDKRIGSASVP